LINVSIFSIFYPTDEKRQLIINLFGCERKIFPTDDKTAADVMLKPKWFLDMTGIILAKASSLHNCLNLYPRQSYHLRGKIIRWAFIMHLLKTRGNHVLVR